MEPYASKPDDERLRNTTIAAKWYSNVEIEGQGQTHFGDRIYQGGQHVYHCVPFEAPRPVAAPRKIINTLPWPKNPDFVGRQDALDSIKHCLDATGSVAITGAGGVGKSQTALEYCWNFSVARSDFHVFWMHAGSVTRFDADYRRLATILGLECHNPGTAIADVRDGVKDWLNTHDNWLMVIDNADRYGDFLGGQREDEGNMIQAAIPRSRPSKAMIIYTSRNARLGAHLSAQPSVQLGIMSASDGIAMFERKYNGLVTEDTIMRLLTALEFLPLSIAHAAAYLILTEIPIFLYLSRIENSDEGLLDVLGQSICVDQQASTSVVKTMKVSFDFIWTHHRAAADLLCFLACLERQNIPSELLSLAADQRLLEISGMFRAKRIRVDLPLSQAGLWTAIAELDSLALVTRESYTLSMHRLVQAIAVRRLVDEGRLSAFAALAAKSLGIVAKQRHEDNLRNKRGLRGFMDLVRLAGSSLRVSGLLKEPTTDDVLTDSQKNDLQLQMFPQKQSFMT